MKQLIVATGNAHKVEEFDGLLADCGFEVHSAKVCGGMPEVVEDGGSFAANARIKALALRAQAPADAWIVSDDSGLEVDALDGAPGIYSARYAGEGANDLDNLNKLLAELAQVPVEQRAARFRCVLCLLDPEGREQFFEGACEGRIATEPTGAAGFGYDPIFVPVGFSKSFAELGETSKSQLSHRALAVKALRQGVL
ncbi:RdgB/HAM1 family non-canonical purine NTP pyrophosphatase [Coraliomargarita sp. SDUM461003]|uniref:dITP/XTP pyrophosphatase n=1 Tax=Thalassobacterium maritimum TaxID=3041265 RepID=A0ABU1AX79_9BACT|nr:RdgB/HAM1 family non-canonical purine NTP pyrophosphatase [Coraliomargarita sp. SDUM461003]MDQ8208202.1 RdgB/HAM1 family non-canonical purine NTP pyrophosphatase [Coraliomargarita sp. SDUM461003]